MSNVNKRLDDLENRSTGGQSVIVVDWGDDRLVVDGVELTRAEFARRFPDHKTITLDDDDLGGE